MSHVIQAVPPALALPPDATTPSHRASPAGRRAVEGEMLEDSMRDRCLSRAQMGKSNKHARRRFEPGQGDECSPPGAQPLAEHRKRHGY